MRFSIWTIFWVFAIFAAAMATFGGAGIFLALGVVMFWTAVFQKPRLQFIEWFTTWGILIVLVALLIPPIEMARGAARRAHCRNNLRCNAFAILNYESAFGNLPAAVTNNSEGKPWISWRLLIAPFVESSPLYSSYNQNEPWNSPNNSRLGFPSNFKCPSHASDEDTTHYLAVVGENSAWPANGMRKLDEITDGAEQTILLIETFRKTVPWAKPEDLSFEEAVELLSSPLAQNHIGHIMEEGFLHKPSRGVHVVCADANVHFLRLPISAAHATALLTVDGGEDFDLQDLSRLTSPELDYARIYACSAFILLALLPVAKRRRNHASIDA